MVKYPSVGMLTDSNDADLALSDSDMILIRTKLFMFFF